ncbi:MAG TPA: MJ0042-type zinc finger domain-containing protein [Gemmataceae bacterium]|nr:MJ0042-type zinc finger domain-containing protein [Gemmataceae bacterium]
MSIPATCPGCNASYQLADSMRGKRVRCKSCSEAFIVRDKFPTPDRYEVEGQIQASPRPAARISRDEKDEDLRRPQPRRRPVKSRGNGAALPLLIGACVLLGVLVLVLGGIAAWVFTRSRPPQPAPIAANTNQPAPAPQPVQAPPPPVVPPVQNPMAAGGPLAVQLTNGNISGFGARMQVTVDYRFTSGNPAGRRLYLFIKATKVAGILQNYYVAQLHTIGNQTQGTISAAGMTFGIENGPFEMWMGEGPIGMGMPLVSERELTKISNVITVAVKQPGLPGMPGMPGIPGMPGRPPFGPRGTRPGIPR